MAVIKRVLCRQRLRKVPSQFSWIDHRLVRDRHLCCCSHPALALYLFLITVCDGQGLSYYSDASIMRLLKLDPLGLAHARQELINAKLVAYQCPLYQVLALEASAKQVQPPAGMNDPVAANSPDTQSMPRASGPEPGEPTRLDQILRRLIDSAQDSPSTSLRTGVPHD
jgi:hypothetical protein